MTGSSSGRDSLRLAVAPTPAGAGGGFQVLIYVNAVEMTSAGAGLGMDPYQVLVPVNRFVATEAPSTVGVARCECGVYGCGVTDVTIVREAGLVHWDWEVQVPMNRRVSFDAGAYDEDVARVGADHSWETPERTAGRLILAAADRTMLARHGLRLDWVANRWREPELLCVAFRQGQRYQIFVTFPWAGRTPEQLAAHVEHTLATVPPQRWPATWHPIQGTEDPPGIAGDGWVRERADDRRRERERRRKVAERDAAILAQAGRDPDLDSLAEYAVRTPMDDLD